MSTNNVSVTMAGREPLNHEQPRKLVDFSCLVHFFKMPVKSVLFGVERTDWCQMLEKDRTLLQTTLALSHSATTTSLPLYLVFVCEIVPLGENTTSRPSGTKQTWQN